MTLHIKLFFFNDTATTEIYTLSLHDALPIWKAVAEDNSAALLALIGFLKKVHGSDFDAASIEEAISKRPDRKSGSAGMPRPISYAVFCLKKKMSISHVFAVRVYCCFDSSC